MHDGSKAIASKSTVPTERSDEGNSLGCQRCEGMELVDCDLCEHGIEGCPLCEGLGLIVCPACDPPANAPLPLVASVQPEICVWGCSAKRGSTLPSVVAGRVLSDEQRPTGRKSCVPLPGPQPEGPGSVRCGERLKWARRQRRMSVAQLAQLAGYSPNALRSYESGEPRNGPPLQTIEDLAQALGVRRSWLAFGLGSVELPQRPASAAPTAR